MNFSVHNRTKENFGLQRLLEPNIFKKINFNNRCRKSFFVFLSAFELTQKKSFLEDFDAVDDLFDGPGEDSMFDFNPEKGKIMQSVCSIL